MFPTPVQILGLKAFPSKCSLCCVDFKGSTRRWRVALRRDWRRWRWLCAGPQEGSTYPQTTPSPSLDSAFACKSFRLGPRTVTTSAFHFIFSLQEEKETSAWVSCWVCYSATFLWNCLTFSTWGKWEIHLVEQKLASPETLMGES